MTLTTPGFFKKSIFQAGVLLAIALVVVSLLWIHEVRMAVASSKTDDNLNDPLCVAYGPYISRLDIRRMELGWEFPKVPHLENPERIKALLPAGSKYDVVVRGGFVAPRVLNRHGGPLRSHIAYAFEMSYRREIESNDGQRIVERRSYGPIRMVKILTAANDMSLDLGPPDQLLFNGISFPGQDAGMSVTSPLSAANAMLSSGVESVARCDMSLAMLEQDPLSGKSVRLVYVDGIGVESIEGLGWSLTGAQIQFLLSQAVLPEGLLAEQAAGETDRNEIDAARLMVYCDPAKPPCPSSPLHIESVADTGAGLQGYRLLRVSSEDDRDDGSASQTNARRRNELTEIGLMRYSQDMTYITEATIDWRFSDLENSLDRLLYESEFRDFQGDPTFTVHYHCRKL